MENDKDDPDNPPSDKSQGTPKTLDDQSESGTPRGVVFTAGPASFVVTERDAQLYFKRANDLLNSTGTKIGGALSSLDALKGTIVGFNQASIVGLQPGLNQYFAEYVEPIKIELETKIEDTSKSLNTLKDFIGENRESLTTLVSVGGQMIALNSLVSSAVKRIDKLETDMLTSWNKGSTILAIAIALITGLCVGATLVVAVIGVYLQFVK